MARLYIEKEQAELEPGILIPVTRQVNNIAEMVDRQIDFSARFSLPLTSPNRDKLGYTDHPNSTRDKAYESPQADVIEGGIPLIENGVLRVLNVGTTAADVMVNGQGYSFWQGLEDIDLHDIDWEDLDFVFSVAGANGLVANTTGVIWPGIDYGGISGNNLDIRYSFPATYLHTIVSRIVSEQGYTLAGDILTDSLYLSAALPFSKSKWQHSKRYIEESSFSLNLNQTFTAGDTNSNFSGNSLNEFGGTILSFAVVNNMTTDISFTYNVTNIIKSLPGTGTSLYIKFALRIDGVVYASQFINIQGTGTFTTASVPMVAGEVVDISVLADFYPGTVTTPGPPMAYTIEVQSGNFYTPEVSKDISLNDTLTPETFIPKTGQKDFLKSVMQLFGLIPEVNESTKTLTFHSLDELYENIPNALDWSEKLVKPAGTLPHIYYLEKTTRIGSYAQKNYANFAADESLADADTGQGYIEVSDTSLAKRHDMFTLPWAACESVTKFVTVPTRIAEIRFFEDDGSGLTQEHQPTQRILYVDFVGGAFSYYDGSTTQFVTTAPVGRFIEPSNAINIGFDNSVLARYYNSLRKILDRAQKLTVACKLSPGDVANLDFFTPIYFKQLGAYYYVNKVENYLKSELTKIEIIKL